MRTPFFAALAAAGLVVAACTSDETGPHPPTGPKFISDTVLANPNNTISAEVVVKATKYDSAFVRYWKAGGSTGQTPAYAFGPDSVVRVPVLGLDTASAYSLEVSIVIAGQSPTAVDTAQFTSGSLPAWIPAPTAQGTDTTPGYLAMALPEGGIVVDNTGKVVWYKTFPGGVLNSFMVQANGFYTIAASSEVPARHHVLDVLGNEVNVLQCAGFPSRYHDLLVEADGNYWIMCDDLRTLDLSGIGGFPDAQVTGTVIQHISAGGQLLFEWNSFDHFQLTDLPALDRSGPAVNFTHGNGLAVDSDGNLLASFRSLSEITKINSSTGAVIWRMGGLQNQFTFLNDSKGFFERQHGLRRGGPGTIQLLDNGLGAPSRFVRYLVNEQTHTALLVMEFLDSPTTFTMVGGSTQYYPSGYSLVSFGRAGRVVEVDPAGNRAWELTGIDNLYVFRAQRFRSLYDLALGL